ncbi:MAG: permease [Firmicutes bacterium]|nr:permease [Bacillota bacterium]
MIFLQILQIFRNLAANTLPLFIIALTLSAVLAEYFPLRSLDNLQKQIGKRSILFTGLFGALMPATPALRVLMAEYARQGGAGWAPILTFIAAAGAGAPALLMTTAVGLPVAFLRLILSVLFAYFLGVTAMRFMQPQLNAAYIESDLEMLCDREFCELPTSGITKLGTIVEAKNIWVNFLNLARVTLPWMILSLLLASIVSTAVSGEAARSVFSGPFAPFKAALLGIPFYFACGTDVPLIYVLLKKGVDLAVVVSLMLAAPLVNFPVFLAAGRWLGYRYAFAIVSFFWLLSSAIGVFLKLISLK